MAFVSLKYPGISLLFGIHLNLFTAPIFLIIFILIIGTYLIIFHFDGEMNKKSPLNSKIYFLIILLIKNLNFSTINFNLRATF